MILIGENQYRTLDDDFYVNGKKVLEAYANGIKVYPVSEREGTLIKFRGKRIFNDTRILGYNSCNNQGWAMGYRADPHLFFQMDEYERRLTGTASFVVTCELTSVSAQDENVEKFVVYGKSLEPCLPMLKDNYAYEPYGNKIRKASVLNLQSHIGNYDTRGKIISTRMGVAGQPSGRARGLYKQNIEPFTMPQTMRIDSGYGYGSDYHVLMTAEELNAWTINDHNNKIYSIAPELSLNSTGEKVWSGVDRYTESNSKIHLRLRGYSDSFYGCYSLNVENLIANDMAYPYQTLIENDNETVSSVNHLAEDITYIEFSIPITEIMYIGSRFTAPDWARNVYESDLDF